MMFVDFLYDVFHKNRDQAAIIWKDQVYSYQWLLDSMRDWATRLEDEKIPLASVVSLEADFSPNAVALLLVLIERGHTIVPLTSSIGTKKAEFRSIAQVEVTISVGQDDEASLSRLDASPDQKLLLELRKSGHPGLVLFSSGSTGKSKAAVHDFVPLLKKFTVQRHSLRTIAFLMFDHIGGINTLLYTLSNGGCLVTVQKRTPDEVCATIAQHDVQILPTSPTFLNLLLLSEAYERHDLSSLECISYGTEVMPESTLKRIHSLFPGVRILQTYGSSEVGIMRSKSRSSDSLWVKVGGEGFQTRIVDGMFEIKAESAMLGYLNAPSPFTADGWIKTGDVVERDGDYVRFLGRRSEIINVGGEKVYPAEVENTLLVMEGVEDVSVDAEPNAITGQAVRAHVKLSNGESVAEFRKRMRKFCKDKLSRFKIPQKVVLVKEDLHGDRFKKKKVQVTSKHR